MLFTILVCSRSVYEKLVGFLRGRAHARGCIVDCLAPTRRASSPSVVAAGPPTNLRLEFLTDDSDELVGSLYWTRPSRSGRRVYVSACLSACLSIYVHSNRKVKAMNCCFAGGDFEYDGVQIRIYTLTTNDNIPGLIALCLEIYNQDAEVLYHK